MQDKIKPAMSPAAFSERFATSLRTTLALIASGELPAINMAINPRGRKPRWRILEEDAIQFINKRRTQPKPTPARRKAQKDPAVIEFF